MDASFQSPTVSAVLNPGATLVHPVERVLSRFAANEMGPQSKKKMVQHLEICAECRNRVARYREVSRRFRDFERSALAQFALGAPQRRD